MSIPRLWMVIALASLLWTPVLAEDDLRARTRDGREVLLKEDGTWEFAPEKSGSGEASEITGTVTKPEKAVLAHKGRLGTMSLWLVPGKWRKLPKPTNVDAEVQYQYIGQDLSAVVIHEDLEIGLEELADLAIGNFEGALTDIEVVLHEHRLVNGREMIAVRAIGKIGKAELMVCAHYASGDFGSIQVFIMVPRKRFEKYETDIEAFLAGMVVHALAEEKPGVEPVKTEAEEKGERE